MFNRQKKRELMSRYSKEQLVDILEETERQKQVLSIQLAESEKVAAEHTKTALTLVFNTINKALAETLQEVHPEMTEEEGTKIINHFLETVTKHMNTITRVGKEVIDDGNDNRGIQN